MASSRAGSLRISTDGLSPFEIFSLRSIFIKTTRWNETRESSAGGFEIDRTWDVIVGTSGSQREGPFVTICQRALPALFYVTIYQSFPKNQRTSAMTMFFYARKFHVRLPLLLSLSLCLSTYLPPSHSFSPKFTKFSYVHEFSHDPLLYFFVASFISTISFNVSLYPFIWQSRTFSRLPTKIYSETRAIAIRPRSKRSAWEIPSRI